MSMPMDILPSDHCDSNNDVEDTPREQKAEKITWLSDREKNRARHALDAIGTQLTCASVWNDPATIVELFELLSYIRVTDKLLKVSEIAKPAHQHSDETDKVLLCTPELLKECRIHEIVRRFEKHPGKAVQTMAQQLTKYWECAIHVADKEWSSKIEQERTFEHCMSNTTRYVRYVCKRLLTQSCWEDDPLIEKLMARLQDIPVTRSILHLTRMMEVLKMYKMHPNDSIRSMSEHLMELATGTVLHSSLQNEVQIS